MAVRIESHAEPIPGYRLIERLGQGGFGEVWKAVAPGGLFKAIKFVYGEIDAAGGDAQRAEQELKAMRRVQAVRHPFILSLERYDIIDGQLIIVMELADKNLWDRFKECRAENLPGIPRDELLQYMEETAEALDLMNATHNLQHLDIKPQNLFVVHNHVKVADFGLVKDLEGMAASVTGGVTPVYAAPETFDQWVSRFSDQYSLAIVYQELLTGQRPFAGNNVRHLILQHLQGIPNLSSLPENDRPIIARALEKIPDQRHPTCQEMVRALRAAGARPSENRLTGTDPLFGPASDTPSNQSRTPEAPELPMPTPQFSGQSMLTPVIPLLAAPTARTDRQGSQGPTRPLGTQGAPPTPVLTPVSKVPSELQAGDGYLLPALVLGVGGAALGVLSRLRSSLARQLRTPDKLPHLRLLQIDTDPDTLKSAARTSSADVLDRGETLLVRLYRPSHYLKVREGRAEIDSWLDPRMLYRINRAQQSGGIRALGRLAFCDNYRLIAHRIKGELEACLDPELLKATAKRTRLGLRTSQPRVYVVAGLAGGSGGGMFLDLAYLVRDLLRQMGFADPDVVGLLLVPPTERVRGTPLVLGNTFAALTELNHFAKGGPFSARYLDRGPGLKDSGAPFQRSVLLELPSGSEGESDAVGGQLAEFLARDLCSPLGRTLDRARDEARSSAPIASYQTFGLYRIAFPRRDLSTRVGRRMCRTLVASWMSKDGAAVRTAAQEWIDEKWSREQFGPESFIEKLHEGVEKKLGRTAEAGFAEILKPLARRAALDPEVIREVLTRLEEQVGFPSEETMGDTPTLLQETLRSVGRAIVAEWGQSLAELVVALIESPGFRLAGAEEAIGHLVAALQQTLEHHEPLGRELASRAVDARDRIHTLIAMLGKTPQKGRSLPTPAEVQELLRCYAKWHYQSQVLQQVSRGLLSLRGLLSDSLREVNFCRTRLAELKRGLEQRDNDEDAAARERREPHDDSVPGRNLYPGGTTTLAEAVEHVLKLVTPEHLARLDADLQVVIRKQFRALVHVCLAPANLLRNLEAVMQEEAEKLLRQVLSSANAAELFLTQYASPEEGGAALETAFEEAAPNLSARGGEVCLLVVPAGPAGERICDLARRTLSEVPLIPVVGGDDILFYREAVQLSLSELEHLGPKGQEAYRQLRAAESFTPHSRTDVREWRNATH